MAENTDNFTSEKQKEVRSHPRYIKNYWSKDMGPSPCVLSQQERRAGSTMDWSKPWGPPAASPPSISLSMLQYWPHLEEEKEQWQQHWRKEDRPSLKIHTAYLIKQIYIGKLVIYYETRILHYSIRILGSIPTSACFPLCLWDNQLHASELGCKSQ